MLTFDGQDPHSYGNTREVHTSHLGLDLRLDFDRHTIDGICELTLVWSHDAAGHVDLDTNGLSITAVTDTHGRALPYEIGPSHPFMGHKLRVSVPEKGQKIRITYHTAPEAGALQWLTRSPT